MQSQADAIHGDDDQVEDFRWATLVTHVLHPTDVQILEAFARIGEPLTAEDLSRILGGWPGMARVIQFRLRRLHKYEVLEIDGTPTGRASFDIPYRLTASPDDER